MAIVQFPGTNFHDLNLDWLLSEMKKCLAEWASTKEEWDLLKGNNEAFTSFITAQFDDFKDYVNNYLANLPITEEISAKINAMVDDGTLLELITHDDGEGSALSDVAGQWLAAHITQETGYVIDDSLTVPGAAADAKATGDAVSFLKSQIDKVETSISTEKTVSGTQRGKRIIDSTGSCATSNSNALLYLVDVRDIEKVTVTSARKENWATAGPIVAMYTNAIDDALDNFTAQTCVLVGTVHNDGNTYTESYYVPETAVTAVIQCNNTYSGTPTIVTLSMDFLTDIAANKENIGEVTSTSFTKPTTGNATKWIPHTITAGIPINVKWTTTGTPLDSANIFTRNASTGENIETVKANAVPDTLYSFTPANNAAGVFVSASASGSINLYDSNTLIGQTTHLQASVDNLIAKSQNVPFVRFDFNPTMYNPSAIFEESGEIGPSSGWANTGDTIFAVHQAFDELVGNGGAGYGYGERIYSQDGATKLYKESAGDTALFDILAPAYVTQGVSQDETITMPIGTDSNGNTVTYTYTYESAVQPYDVRLYKFHDTNNALHSNTKDIPKKKLLIFGGTHGNEFCAPVNLFVFAKHLCSDYANPDMLKLRSSFDVYIVPYLNGFGCQYRWNNGGSISMGSRSNGHMVDINRNCDTYGWKGLSGTSEEITASFENKLANLGVNTYQGPTSGSEFESQLAKALIQYLKPDVVIDHHHNNGNNPFYTISSDADAGMLVYQAANDVAYAEMHNYPQYYGTAYNLYLGSEVSPATKAASNGYLVTMAGELGVKMNATSEMSESIAWLNGVYDSGTKAATKFGSDVFSVSEYALLNVILHLCQYAMEH